VPGWWSEETGAIAREDGWTWARRFVHYFWVGDEDRGLTWFCETEAKWAPKGNDQGVCAAREGDTVRFTLNVIDAPVVIDHPYSLTFGLQATPLKPMPAGRHGWGNRRNLKVLWTTPETNTHFGYPEAPAPAAYRETIESIHEAGRAVVPFILLSMLSDGTAQWR